MQSNVVWHCIKIEVKAALERRLIF